jgi:hypothetical protein
MPAIDTEGESMLTRHVRLVLVALAFLVIACEPKDRRPGLWLSGEVVEEPVADWTFVNSVPEIFLETKTWYGIPHSVTVASVGIGDRLYVPSVYRERGVFPDERAWNRNVVRDPRVRLEIGDRIYERKAVLVEDAAEWQAVLEAFAAKSPFWAELAAQPEDTRPKLYFLRMEPREAAS